jgi:alcohol dehydrogenase (cytochrome c)
LTQITPANVKDLELKWVWQAQSLEKFEATALAVNGVLYTVQAPNDLVALDGATGRPFWTYSYTPAANTRTCCGRVNRGVAILGTTLFMGTLDAHLIAVDARSGQLILEHDGGRLRRPLFDHPRAARHQGQGLDRHRRRRLRRPRLHRGSRRGHRQGAVALLHDSRSGRTRQRDVVGRFVEDRRRGVWNIGAYDPRRNLTFWGTGNPAPDWDGRSRLGDNLYSDSVVALDADTGRLKWHYQFTPHDELDYDSTQVPLLADITWQGRPRKVILWANRNGVMYVLDRNTGEFLKGKAVRKGELDGWLRREGPSPPRAGHGADPRGNADPAARPRRHELAAAVVQPQHGLVLPGALREQRHHGGGGASSRARRVPMRVRHDGATEPAEFLQQGRRSLRGHRAYDPATLDPKWEFTLSDITWAGVLTTAADVLFSGGKEGYFLALDARTGALLWKQPSGGQVNSGPMSFAVGASSM